MPALVLLAPKPLSGKTTIAVALAGRISAQGKTVFLSRLGDDENAAADKALFAGLPGPTKAEVTLTEAPAGETSADAARALVVADGSLPAAEIAEFCQSIRGNLAGVVMNRVPARRMEAVRAEAQVAGLKALDFLAEDRLLASPTLGEVARALNAEKMFFDSQSDRPLDRTLIAPISADPGQGYFQRTGAETVIVRSDKPDLQLAALNAGVSAMIVTGDLPILGYVLDRAEDDRIPLLRTKLGTVEAVGAIEGLYGRGPFAGGTEKRGRAVELAGAIDLGAILS